jgi:integrase
MGHINKTPSGSFRANWRDPSGRQCSKTFPTKKEATAYLAEITATLNRGIYVNPTGAKTKFGPYALAWLAGRNNERATVARDSSLMHTHIMARWADWPLGRIDHSAVQTWVTQLSERLAPATVAKIEQLTSGVFTAAIRDRLISANPCDGVKLPAQRWTDTSMQVLTRDQFRDLLLHIPDRHRALVAMGAGTGLRWGELVGLRLDAIDQSRMLLRVIRTLTEVAGHVQVKPYPKSRAGRRTVPIPGFALAELERHVKAYPPGPDGLVFVNSAGGPLRRTLFRSRVWRPALVRAGLLGDVTRTETEWRAMWEDSADTTHFAEFPTEREAVAHVARHCAGPCPRFHDLRHSFATWLVSDGVPINDVSKVMGHEQTSTTLNRYTHPSPAYVNRVRDVFADFPLTADDDQGPETTQATDDSAA